MEKFIDFINSKISTLDKEAANLAASNKEDESNLIKIKSNVYGICKTVFETFKRVKPAESIGCEYLKKLSELRSTWEAAKQKADEHGDIKRSVVEQLKVEALVETENKFKELGGSFDA